MSDEKRKVPINGGPVWTPDAGTPTPETKPNGQYKDYWVLSPEERSKGWVRPYRHSYVHGKCGGVTRMSRPIAETYARDPKFYGATFCVGCGAHFSVSEFVWDGTNEEVGS